MIPPKRIEEIENLLASNRHVYLDRPQRHLHNLVSDLLAERKQLVAIVEAIDKLRNTSLKYGTWYTGCPCEFAENVDDALKAWKEGE